MQKEMNFKKTRDFWNGELVRGNLKYPNEQVMRFVKRNYKNPDDTTILDFGCGMGRDTIALLSEGYKVVAMDYTDNAIERLNSLEHKNLTVIQNYGLKVPIDGETVEAVIADGSLFCNGINDTITLLSNLKNAMKESGKIWADWRSTEDSMCAVGEKLENGLYQLDKTTNREGCSYLFVSIDDIEHMYAKAGLSICSIEEYKYTEQNRTHVCAWYHVIAERGKQ